MDDPHAFYSPIRRGDHRRDRLESGRRPAILDSTASDLPEFGMSTTVWVPDRGRAYAGGVNRSYRSSSRRGTPLLPSMNRSVSSGTSASGVSVSAWVHDFEEMDQQVLDQWKQQSNRQAGVGQAGVLAEGKASRHAGTPINHGQVKVSDVRRAVAAKEQQRKELARRYIATARRLEQNGKYAAARAVYRNAARYADPNLKARIETRVATLPGRPR